ncbi:MAG: hypothetical protein ACXV4B_09085, partial [Halobacteriota archaeon]
YEFAKGNIMMMTPHCLSDAWILLALDIRAKKQNRYEVGRFWCAEIGVPADRIAKKPERRRTH